MKIKKRHLTIGAAAIGVLLVLFVALSVAGGNASENAATANTGAALGTGDVVRIPLADISETAQFYTYEDNGVNINYFVVLGSDGKPRTAFDACDVCGGYKGYQQTGTDITCRNCGRVFRIDGLGTQNKGYGCWPSYLPHELDGDDIVIQVNDIKKEGAKFA